MGIRINALTESTTAPKGAYIPADLPGGTRRIDVDAIMPVGTVIQTARTTAPTGFLACDGSAVSRTTYANLFSAIGTTYGTGDGSTTFNLPDMRGLFPRGAGAHGTMTKAAGGAFDGGSVGAASNDSFQGHIHRITDSIDGFGTVASGSINNAGGNRGNILSNSPDGRVEARVMSTDGTNGTPRTGNETKPASMSLLYCIKY